jgi:hypothetical protein
MTNTITIDKKDLKNWIAKLSKLQKCNLNPEKCTHDRDEQSNIQKFDYASVDMALDQVISEMKNIV